MKPVNVNAGGKIFTVSHSALEEFLYFKTLFNSGFDKEIFLDVDPDVFQNWLSCVRSPLHKVPKDLRAKVKQLTAYLQCDEYTYEEPKKYYEITKSSKCQVNGVYIDFLNYSRLPKNMGAGKKSHDSKIKEIFVGFSQKHRQRGEDLSKEGITFKLDSKIVYFLRADEIPLFSENVSYCLSSPIFENCANVYKINKKFIKMVNSLMESGKNVEILFRHNDATSGGIVVNLKYYVVSLM